MPIRASTHRSKYERGSNARSSECPETQGMVFYVEYQILWLPDISTTSQRKLPSLLDIETDLQTRDER